jgi:aspartyl-tRNA synthetase
MSRYGSDKPDLRFGLELQDLTGLLKNTEFKVFAGAIEGGGSVRALCVKGAADTLSRKEIDKLVDFVKTYKAKGLAYTRLTQDAETSSYEKFLTEDEKTAIRSHLGAETGDVILIVADPREDIVFDSLGALRCHLAERLGLIDPNAFEFLWVVDFPLFEIDPETGAIAAKHHPFTSPNPADLDKMESDPASVRARAYDIVLNGTEVGGGSIRISDSALQERMFTALGLDAATIEERFGWLVEAFKYGAPPHGGLAYGLDRLVMLMLHKASIRDVIAFPKVQNASDLMVNCPSPVEKGNLDELGIQVSENRE